MTKRGSKLKNHSFKTKINLGILALLLVFAVVAFFIFNGSKSTGYAISGQTMNGNTSLNYYTSIGSNLLQLQNVYIGSSYINDYVQYYNPITNQVLKTYTPSSRGSTSIAIGGTIYNVSYGGSMGGTNSWAQISGSSSGNISVNSLYANISINGYVSFNDSSTILQLQTVYISSGSPSNDYVQYYDLQTGQVVKAYATDTRGTAFLSLNGSQYNVSYGGPLGSSSSSWAQITGTSSVAAIAKSLYSNVSINDYISSEIPKTSLKLTSVYISSSYINDYVQYYDLLTGNTIKAVPFSEGVANLMINGTDYLVHYGGLPGSSDSSWAQIVNYCRKSDNANPEVKGLLNSAYFSGWDFCTNSSSLVEYYCTGDTNVESNHVYSCSSGCSNGVCLGAVLNQQNLTSDLNQINSTNVSGETNETPSSVNASENLTNQTSSVNTTSEGNLSVSNNQTQSLNNSHTTNNTLVCTSGCLDNGKCFSYGYRIGFRYCSPNGAFVDQLSSGSCDNNFECLSNICANSECVSPSFIQRIINFFKKLFGVQ